MFEDAKPLPDWEPQTARLLDEAARRVRLIGYSTPINLRAELAALERAFAQGSPREPLFEYARADCDQVVMGLERRAKQLEDSAPDELKPLYINRLRELATEAKLCTNVNTDRFASLAAERYPRRDKFDEEADALCQEWIRPDSTSEAVDTIRSDDAADPRSLLSQMQAAVGTRRLAVRVIVSTRLSALAATGAGVVYVATNHMLTEMDARRTVLHEIEGHVLPRVRAAQSKLSIFRIGTRFGSDDQEGRALCIEDAAGVLQRTRRIELARRHLACRMVMAGASFVDTAYALRELGSPISDTLRISARAHRGRGLARERVYLPAMLRVREARRDPAIDKVLASGRVSIEAAPSLRSWAELIPTT